MISAAGKGTVASRGFGSGCQEQLTKPVIPSGKRCSAKSSTPRCRMGPRFSKRFRTLLKYTPRAARTVREEGGSGQFGGGSAAV